ncbi:hypothetical protein [Nocardia mangyaensis]|nr:hypothetical protein [Nocardia mangyaensis]
MVATYYLLGARAAVYAAAAAAARRRVHSALAQPADGPGTPLR